VQTRRVQWAEHVRHWRQSGLTAREFAKRVGVNAGTLSHWAWRLGRAQSTDQGRAGHHPRAAARPKFVELVADAIADRRFELDLGDGRRLRIPSQFDTAGLEQLLAVLAKPAK